MIAFPTRFDSRLASILTLPVANFTKFPKRRYRHQWQLKVNHKFNHVSCTGQTGSRKHKLAENQIRHLSSAFVVCAQMSNASERPVPHSVPPDDAASDGQDAGSSQSRTKSASPALPAKSLKPSFQISTAPPVFTRSTGALNNTFPRPADSATNTAESDAFPDKPKPRFRISGIFRGGADGDPNNLRQASSLTSLQHHKQPRERSQTDGVTHAASKKRISTLGVSSTDSVALDDDESSVSDLHKNHRRSRTDTAMSRLSRRFNRLSDFLPSARTFIFYRFFL
jgi:hypothetical protein